MTPPLNRRQAICVAALTTGASAVNASANAAQIGDCSAVVPSPKAFGIVGDGKIDDTAALRRYSAACEIAGQSARLGRLAVKISGPVTSRIPLIFDQVSFGSLGDPGIYVTGSGYTALTFTHSINDLAVTVYGSGTVELDGDGTIRLDTRPYIDGIAFGAPDGQVPFLSSFVRSVRVFRLAGCAVRKTSVWDTTFSSISIEECGTADIPSYMVSASRKTTCNQMNVVRLQVERSIGRAISIHANTLSSTFGHIHSEGIIAVPGALTWELGGDVNYVSVRLHAQNPKHATALVRGQHCMLSLYRVEDDIRTDVDASGGHIFFNAPAATLAAYQNQSGRVTISGGAITLLAIGAGWSVAGSYVARLTLGFMPTETSTTLSDCTVAQFAPEPRHTTGSVTFRRCHVTGITALGNGLLRKVVFADDTSFTPWGGVGYFAEQEVILDGTSRILGSVHLVRTTFRWSGLIKGDVWQDDPNDRRAIATIDASATGRVTGWAPPTTRQPSLQLSNGLYCKSFENSEQNVAGAAVLFGWYYAGDWIEVRNGAVAGRCSRHNGVKSFIKARNPS
jgi:hypothetical protein